ncbi:Rv2578c family radical SAM protein [Dactylosporangium matsuzakiense]|uniref:Radical SAM protein n=1 Tax=Dactylosporangium matsuzakiense TaxID=53360 RepID=A0A9W6KX53_9ACTN|nr:Rv2578c family radical SAM protein [Dactylosporangium matsuzakiense]UWZ40904.1 Rv2578c family radical SAM protein [Dactylosporangium matsuzakiense]GLL08299.1 radical SAM protein [Dactylosporangium matsuzakiense]
MNAPTAWDGQRIDAIAPGTLPGLGRVQNLVRSVRTPEFEGVTFHEVLTKSALNHVPATSAMLPGEWTLNPYRGCTHACAYCFARPTHEHLGLGLGADFDAQIIVKVNVAEVLRRELATKRVLPERVAFGTNTDPYQRAEGRYTLMPPIIDALTGARVPFSILTKGTLIRRDLDRLAAAAQKVNVELGLSIAYLDDDLQRTLEPGAPSTAARLDTLRAMRDAGFAPTVFLAPILPYLTDSAEQLDATIAELAAAGAANVLPTSLYLQKGVKDLVLQWLRRRYPELLPAYADLYATGSRTPRAYRDTVKARVHQALHRHGLPVPDDSTEDKFALLGKRRPPPPPPEPTLF